MMDKMNAAGLNATYKTLPCFPASESSRRKTKRKPLADKIEWSFWSIHPMLATTTSCHFQQGSNI